MATRIWLKLVIAVGLSLLAGVLGSAATMPAIESWYAGLIKPVGIPPNWLFGPVWTVLYILMGLAAGWIWGLGLNQPAVKTALAVFSGQLILNVLWSLVFFGWQAPGRAIFIIIALGLLIVWMLILFYRIKPWTGLILVPYLAWVTFAAYLNIAIWWLN